MKRVALLVFAALMVVGTVVGVSQMKDKVETPTSTFGISPGFDLTAPAEYKFVGDSPMARPDVTKPNTVGWQETQYESVIVLTNIDCTLTFSYTAFTHDDTGTPLTTQFVVDAHTMVTPDEDYTVDPDPAVPGETSYTTYFRVYRNAYEDHQGQYQANVTITLSAVGW